MVTYRRALPSSVLQSRNPPGIATAPPTLEWGQSSRMNKLKELQPNISALGILLNSLVTLLYRHDEVRIEIAVQGQLWSFDGGGHLFRLVSKAQRIRLAHLLESVVSPCRI